MISFVELISLEVLSPVIPGHDASCPTCSIEERAADEVVALVRAGVREVLALHLLGVRPHQQLVVARLLQIFQRQVVVLRIWVLLGATLGGRVVPTLVHVVLTRSVQPADLDLLTGGILQLLIAALPGQGAVPLADLLVDHLVLLANLQLLELDSLQVAADERLDLDQALVELVHELLFATVPSFVLGVLILRRACFGGCRILLPLAGTRFLVLARSSTLFLIHF